MRNINLYLSAFLLMFSVILFIIALYSFKSKYMTGKNAFGLICTCACIYSFGYAMELFSSSLDKIVFWTYIEYIGIPFIPAFWLIFALKYCEKDHFLNKRTYAHIFAIPVITFILRYTNNFHHLYYIKISLYNNGFFNLISIQKGPWYYVSFLYANIVELISSYLYWQLFFKTNSKMRSQALMMFFASIFPWVSILAIILSKTPYGIDPGPFAISISSLLFLLALFKFNFLNLKPIARDKVFEWSEDGIIILDYNYSIIDFNKSASKIIKSLDSKAIGKNIKEHLKNYTSLISSLIHSEEAQFETSSDGISSYYSLKHSVIHDDRKNIIGHLIFLHDITDHVNTMEKLNCIACTDELTGVFNRRHFTELSESEISRAKRYNHPLSFIIIDLDFFKIINDKYGHLAGDVVLKNISTICRKSIRYSDILGRFGGEEFMILLPETQISEATVQAERICENIKASEIIYNSEKISITASLGVTGTDSVKDENLNTFFKFADMALYAAKSHGRNCVKSVSLNN